MNDACVEVSTELCRSLGPYGPVAAMAAYVVLQIWKHRDKVRRSDLVVKKVTAVEQTVTAVEQKVEKALSTPPAPSASSPALTPVVIPVSPLPAELLSAQVDGQSDRETKP